jgi:hypothetical protein
MAPSSPTRTRSAYGLRCALSGQSRAHPPAAATAMAALPARAIRPFPRPAAARSSRHGGGVAPAPHLGSSVATVGNLTCHRLTGRGYLARGEWRGRQRSTWTLWIASSAAAPANATSQAPRLKKVAAEPTPSSDARTPPSTTRERRPAGGPPASARCRVGWKTRPSPQQLPGPPKRRSPLRCTFDDAGHETSVHSHDQVAHHGRRSGPLGPYGLSPI